MVFSIVKYKPQRRQVSRKERKGNIISMEIFAIFAFLPWRLCG